MSQVTGCSILPPDQNNLSPHLPIICRLTITSPETVTPSPYRILNTMKCSDVLDWSCARKIEAYKSILDELLSASLPDSSDSLDEVDAVISHCLHAAARAAECSKARLPARSWWTPGAAAARDRSRFWHRLWNHCGRPDAGAVSDCYREARRSYRRARREAALSHIEQEARFLRLLRRKRDMSAFWRRVQQARRGGLPATSNCNAADFQDHFQKMHQDSREQLSDVQKLIVDAVEAHEVEARAAVCARVVSPDQVAGLLRRLRRGKAPGLDGVTPEHLLFGSTPALLTALARLLTGCLSTSTVPKSFTESAVVPILKKSQLNPNCLDNYRPISITTCASKLLELLILDELQSSFIPHDLQFGFISRRSTTEASLLVGEAIQHNRKMGLPVFAANLDARKCFDRIWHDGLFYRLAPHLSNNCWLLVVNWYRHLTSRVTFDGAVSERFPVLRGTRQGAILSPCLANVYLFPLLRDLDQSGNGAYLHQHHVPAVCYADDLFLLSTNTLHLGVLLNMVGKFAQNWRLDFTHPDSEKTKSHCIIFGEDYLSQKPSWVLSGQHLQTRSRSEHLGVVLDSSFSAGPHVEERMKRARSAFYGLAPIGMLAKGLSPEDKTYIWKTLISPALSYGCSIASLGPADMESLGKLQASCIKTAFGLPRTAHHSGLLAASGIPAIHEAATGQIFRA